MEFKHLKTEKTVAQQISDDIFLWPLGICSTILLISSAVIATDYANGNFSTEETSFLWFIYTFPIFCIILAIVLIIRAKNVSTLKKLQKEFDEYEQGEKTIVDLHQQKHLLEEIKITESNIGIMKNNLGFNYSESKKHINEQIEEYNSPNIPKKEFFYKIALEIETFRPLDYLSNEYKEISKILDTILYGTIKKFCYALGTGMLIFYIVLFIIASVFRYETLLQLVFISLIIGVLSFFIGAVFGTEPSKSNEKITYSPILKGPNIPLSSFKDKDDKLFPFYFVRQERDFIQEKIQEYIDIITKSEEISAESSLFFADSIRLFSEKIEQSQEELAIYGGKWTYLFIFPMKVPDEVVQFFENEEQKILDSVNFAKKAVGIFAEIESKKLKTISSQNQTTFGHLQLSNKRQEILLQSLENLKK